MLIPITCAVQKAEPCRHAQGSWTVAMGGTGRLLKKLVLVDNVGGDLRPIKYKRV